MEQFVVYDLLEPDALQSASPVLRGRDYSDIVLLPDHSDARLTGAILPEDIKLVFRHDFVIFLNHSKCRKST